jgi:transcriptional regulator with XRE-family HTH domain
MSTGATLGDRLRQARELSGLSARALDRLAGLASAHSSHIERGVKKSISVDTAIGLARVLGISLDWLLTGAGDEPSFRRVADAVDQAEAIVEARAKSPPPTASKPRPKRRPKRAA